MSAAVWVWVNPSLSISISNQLVSLTIEILYKPIFKNSLKCAAFYGGPGSLQLWAVLYSMICTGLCVVDKYIKTKKKCACLPPWTLALSSHTVKLSAVTTMGTVWPSSLWPGNTRRADLRSNDTTVICINNRNRLMLWWIKHRTITNYPVINK